MQEQLELDLDKDILTGDTIKTTPLTRNVRLTKAYELLFRFRDFPQSRLEQEALIRIYYPSIKVKYTPSKRLAVQLVCDDQQIFDVAKRLYLNAAALLINRPIEEKWIIQKLFLLDRALRRGTDPDYREALDERICIQLEPFSDKSDLVREYYMIKADH